MERRIAVRAIIFKDGKLLSVKLTANASLGAQNYWCTIGGGVDDGEGLLDAVKREVIEETGIEPEIGELLYVQQFRINSQEHLEFFFNIINVDKYLDINLSDTSHGELEIAELDFINPSTEHVLPAFLTQTDIAGDIRSGETKFFNYL